MTYLTIVAIIIGPVLAVYIGHRIADRQKRRDAKFQVLANIVAMQWKTVSEEGVKMLNLIDLVFHDAPEVRAKWKSYHEALYTKEKLDDTTFEQWRKLKISLIHEMSRHLGFKESLDQLDFDRIYSPIGLSGPNINTEADCDEAIDLIEEIRAKIIASRAN